MLGMNQADVNNLVLDLMTYQAFVAGLTHIPEMMATDGLSLQESLLRVLTETCESGFAFAAIRTGEDHHLRIIAKYYSAESIELPESFNSPAVNTIIDSGRPDMIFKANDNERQVTPGVNTALVVPYKNRGADCVVCVCNRNQDSFARPALGVPWTSHEVKMIQALVQLIPV